MAKSKKTAHELEALLLERVRQERRCEEVQGFVVGPGPRGTGWIVTHRRLGNAGELGVLTPLSHLNPKVWQKSIEVNVTANWRLIRSLDPLLRKSDAARVLFISSGAARNFARRCTTATRAMSFSASDQSTAESPPPAITTRLSRKSSRRRT